MAVLLMLGTSLVITGCGSGGYPGGGTFSLSSSTLTLDAGQTVGITSTIASGSTLTWTLAGASCTAAACGTLSSSTGTAVSYTAPPVTAPIQVTLTGGIAGTQSQQTVAITVNPDPAIQGNPPAGVVGVAYRTTLTTTGGTGPLTLSIASGALPAGLAFNAATGVISGTPTAAGTTIFSVRAVDSASVPYTVMATQSITITAGGTATLTVSGAPPSGTVGTSYSTALNATGGTGPYTWSVLSGSLPPGLTLNASTGVISGTPTTQGAYAFTAQAQDATGAKASANFAVVINAAQVSLTLNNGTLPSGTVGTPYSATIGVSGGSSPYTCVFTSALPAGLTANGCVVSGTPTTAGTVTTTVKVTDASNPANTLTGPETITINAAPVLTFSSPPAATVGTPYTGTIPVSGGNGPYSCSLAAGSLPAGLTLNGCTISGTPTTPGTTTVTVKGTDSSSPVVTTTAPVTIVVNPAALALGTTALANGTVGVPYSSTIVVSGGTAPYNCVFTAGTLPAGLALNGCTVSGTPTTAGSANLTVKATDSNGNTVSGPESITISGGTTLVISSPPAATVGTPYTGVIPVSGGSGPYTCSVTAGTLPAGLTLNGCTVSGTPTTSGSTTITVKGTDSANPPGTGTGPVTLTVNPAGLALSTTTLPGGTVGVPYNSTIGVTGGIAPYSCVFTSGILPAGLSLTGCTVSGTPTTAGTSTLTVKATDSNGNTVSGPESITIAPATLALSTTTLPGGTVGVPYTAAIGVTGGTAPYTCAFTSGTLPAGLSLAGCTVGGTPTTAGTSTLTVKATDSNGNTVSGPESITIAPATLALSTTTLPGGTVGVPYTAAIGVTGGTAPYSCVFTSGTLPAGLSLTGCVVSGTPTTSGTANLTVKATDSNGNTVSGPESITISPAPLALATSSLPNGTVGVPYNAAIGVTGGAAPYSCVFTSGTLPAGLSLTGCTVSGTPTVAGSANLTVKATDSNGNTVSGPESITIAPAAATLTISSPPAATVGVPYTGTIPVSGGTAPYTCTLVNGTVPAGLTLTGCTLSGTPTTAGSSVLTVQATDASNPAVTTSGPVTVTVNPAPVTLTITSPPAGTVGVAYTGPIGITGGTGPYTCTQTGGTLPAGLTLTGCTVSGTPTTAGAGTIAVTVTDSGNPKATTSGPVAVTINPVPALTFTGSLPNAVVNQPYTQTLAATGGLGPYTYALTAGTLPAGITLSQTGVVSGTPTAVGAYSFTVTATDSEGTPQTAALPLVLLVTYAQTPTDAELNGPYAFLFQGYDDVLFGVLAYKTDTIGSFTADGKGVATAGELDSNHQLSASLTGTVASNRFLGTYQLNADNRGLLTITALNADGTVGGTHTYAISVKAPVAPQTTTAQGSLIEFDNDQLVGTKGSGTLLRQDATQLVAGLNGSYAFGLQGDSPCLVACTVNLAPGPVAAVGALTANGGTIGGVGDANIAAATFALQPLSGAYGAADANGRVQMTMATGSLPAGYPTHYAVYVVDANRALVMSTDVHSVNALLAGSAQLQTQATYSSSAMTGPFIGYENSATNPGMVSATLQNTLNFSTATIFRATGTGDGVCTVTNVDVGGVDSLVTALTALGGNLTGLNNLFGTYRITGNTSCAVTSSGRGVLAYPQQTLLGAPIGTPPAPRVFYLSSPETGFFLETGYAGLGNLEPQTGAPFSLATFNGTYVYASTPASTLASINTSGFIVADGAGHETSTVDANVGVGTINVLQLGSTSSGTYVYASQDPAVGRYTINGTTVIYAINPGRFVLVDTNPLTTSPSITLLY